MVLLHPALNVMVVIHLTSWVLACHHYTTVAVAARFLLVTLKDPPLDLPRFG